LQFRNKDFSVADFPGPGCLADHVDHLFELIVGDGNINFHFRQKIDAVFRAAVQLGMPFLTPKAFYLSDSKPLNPNGRERFTHVFKFEWFDYHSNQFHISPPVKLGNGLSEHISSKASTVPNLPDIRKAACYGVFRVRARRETT